MPKPHYPHTDAAHAAASLAWQREAGVDELVADTPQPLMKRKQNAQDHLDQAMAQLSTKKPASQVEALFAPAQSEGLAGGLAEATRLAASANSVAELAAAVTSYDGVGLKRTAQRTVFGDGNPDSRLLLIGEAPGEEEDRQGVPFCGRSGQLLTRMFESIGLTRTRDYFISNSVYWRPPANRVPTAEEVALCRPFMLRLIELMQPRILVLIGGVAAKAVLQQEVSVSRMRTASPTLSVPGMDKPVPVRVLYHPAYLLRNPAQKSAAWADMLALKAVLEEIKE